MSNFCCTFAVAKVKTIKYLRNMLATPVRESGSQPIMSNYENEVYYTRGEFMDELAKQLGQAYGLNDIREAR